MTPIERASASSLPRVALVRGPGLSSFEMQSYEPLLNRYALQAFALARNASDLSAVAIPYEQLDWPDSIRGRSLCNALYARIRGQRYYMPGLQSRLKDTDIVHSSEITTAFSWQVARAHRKLRYRMVITSTENIPLPGWDDAARAREKAEILDNTGMFLALTRAARHVLTLEGVPESKIRVVPFGLDLERFRPAAPDEKWVQRLGIQPREFVVLYVGRLVWEKGIFDLLNALQTLNPENLHLLMVGDGPELPRLRRYIEVLNLKCRVTFSPAVKYASIEQVHRLASVLVLPSVPTQGVREQFGLALVEAMACGKPVIASRTGSMPEVVQDAGLLTNPADSMSLAEALQQLRDSPDLCCQLASRGRQLAEQCYDRNKVAETIHEVYQSVLSRNGA